MGAGVVLPGAAQHKGGKNIHVVVLEKGVANLRGSVLIPQVDGKALLIQRPAVLAEHLDAGVELHLGVALLIHIFKVDGTLPILPEIGPLIGEGAAFPRPVRENSRVVIV